MTRNVSGIHLFGAVHLRCERSVAPDNILRYYKLKETTQVMHHASTALEFLTINVFHSHHAGCIHGFSALLPGNGVQQRSAAN